MALILGVALGIGIGLFYTWVIDPVIERNVAPWQLSDSAREDYVLGIVLRYDYYRRPVEERPIPDDALEDPLRYTFDSLVALKPDLSVWDMLADIACERHTRTLANDPRENEIINNNDIRVMRVMMELYRSQGASGCADGFYSSPVLPTINPPTPVPIFTATPTLTPLATKTPAPSVPTDIPVEIPSPTITPPPSGSYIASYPGPNCDPTRSGIIEVQVFDARGQPVPGVLIQVAWGGNQKETFYTGLKPDKGLGYADFEMTPGVTYSVTIAGLASAPRPVEAAECDVTPDGIVIWSYPINFYQQAD